MASAQRPGDHQHAGKETFSIWLITIETAINITNMEKHTGKCCHARFKDQFGQGQDQEALVIQE